MRTVATAVAVASGMPGSRGRPGSIAVQGSVGSWGEVRRPAGAEVLWVLRAGVQVMVMARPPTD